MMDIDEVYEKIGQFGVHQKKIFAAIGFLNIYFSFHMLHMVFIGAEPHFFCTNSKKMFEGCPTDNTTCVKAVFYGSNFTSIVSEWELVCAESYKSAFVQSLFMFGVLMGAFIFGILSDKYGRRITLFIGVGCLSVFSLAGAFAWSYSMYCGIRFIVGIFCGGCILVSFVLLSEVIGSEKRATTGILMAVWFAVGIMIFSLLAYLIREWRTLSIAVTLPGLSIVCFYWLLPESPRWLLSRGNPEKAAEVLETIAAKNRVTNIKAIELNPLPVPKAPYTLIDVFKHGELRKRTLIQIYAWFVNSSTYYGLTMSAGSLGSSLYTSLALSGLVEIPAYALTVFLLDRYGRRLPFAVFMMMGGAACLTILVLPKGATLLVTVCALTGKLAISASFSVAYVYSAELYPTVVRNNAMGICSVSARVGGVVSPVMVAMGQSRHNLHFILFGLLSFTSGLLNMVLPETVGQPLPETLDDLAGTKTVRLTEQTEHLTLQTVKLMEDEISKEQARRDEEDT